MNEELNMEYNSGRENLVIPEYGRNIQKLIEYAKTIEHPIERQRFSEEIVDLMMQMNPQNKSGDDNVEKLWKHLFRIANYELNVEPPEGIAVSREDSKLRPDQLEYPVSEARFRHYGHNVQVLIKKALEMEPGPKRRGFVKAIASYMKLAYQTWNKEHFVSDEVVKSDLEALSGGKLKLDEETSIDQLTQSNRRRQSRGGSSGGRGRGKGRKRK
ncbi:MAG: DUF4290 domain-containing protein [Saprospiraceae bacterium]|nr:DUF4290 domain-containing protein [Saprospiraceae bacterium]